MRFEPTGAVTWTRKCLSLAVLKIDVEAEKMQRFCAKATFYELVVFGVWFGSATFWLSQGWFA
jgi:hypothetical protein